MSSVPIDRDKLQPLVDALNGAIDDTHPEGDDCDICRAADALDEYLATGIADLRHQPGDRHVYRTLCEVCGIRGQLYIALVPERDQPAPPLTFGEQIADESPLGRRIAEGKAEDSA